MLIANIGSMHKPLRADARSSVNWVCYSYTSPIPSLLTIT